MPPASCLKSAKNEQRRAGSTLLAIRNAVAPLLANGAQIELHQIKLALQLVDAPITLHDLRFELITLIVDLLLTALTRGLLGVQLADGSLQLIQETLSLRALAPRALQEPLSVVELLSAALIASVPPV